MVRIERGTTDEHLEEVYSHPSMQKLSHDHRKAEPIRHPLVSYYSVFNMDEFMGAFMVISTTPIDKEIHILLLPKSVKAERTACKLIIDEVLKNSDRISAVIIDGMNTTKNLVSKLGFKLEGIKRQACQQNGQMKDLYFYGLLKSEWKGE